jgi:chromosome segregation ATPase
MDDPFGEVNNMIEKMIFRLMNEQTDEDNHKHWCDQEISKTNTSRSDKENKVEELTAKIDEADAHAGQLTEDITAADEMVAKITAFVAEATEIRKVGKKENALAMKDAQDAQTAIANAVSVLTQFYKESGMVAKEAWEFVQRGRRGVELPENPATWDSSYTGVADPTAQPDGITAVLEQVASDFAAMEADTRAQEAEDQKLFEDDMKASAIEKAERAKESEVKNQERGRVITKSDSMKKQRKHVDGELEAVNQYYKDLGPACYEGDSTYEDRKAARTAEIDALKEAEGILATAFDESAEPTMLKAQKKPSKAKFLDIRRH